MNQTQNYDFINLLSLVAYKAVPDHDQDRSFSELINNVFGIDCTLKIILLSNSDTKLHETSPQKSLDFRY